MRFYPFKTLTLLVLALLATSAVAWKPMSKDDAGACAAKNQDAAQAIASFCQRFPYVSFEHETVSTRTWKDISGRLKGYLLTQSCFLKSVPGRDARLGRYSKNQKIVAKIVGNCKPAEKVPQKWCFKQFYHMCRNGKPNGTRVAKYGGGGCQTWAILQKGWKVAG